MARTPANLDSFERSCSALFGAALTCLAVRNATASGIRALAGAAGAFLLYRAATGHCAVKAAMRPTVPRPETVAEPPASEPQRQSSTRLDETLQDSFPASDPPASRLPDEPPRNAQEKWAAARAAQAATDSPGGGVETREKVDKNS